MSLEDIDNTINKIAKEMLCVNPMLATEDFLVKVLHDIFDVGRVPGKVFRFRYHVGKLADAIDFGMLWPIFRAYDSIRYSGCLTLAEDDLFGKSIDNLKTGKVRICMQTKEWVADEKRIEIDGLDGKIYGYVCYSMPLDREY